MATVAQITGTMAVMPSQAPYISRAQKRFLKKVASFFYVTVTIVIVTVFLRDWSQTWVIDASPRTRQLRSVKIYTEVELIPPRTTPRGERLQESIKTTAKEASTTYTKEPSLPASTDSAPTTDTELPVEHKTTLTTRATCNQHYFLLILVSSAPAYLDRRRIIRQTWAADSAIKTRWKTVFLLGQSRDKNHSELLLREEAFYGDLIRADYYESYWNQTL